MSNEFVKSPVQLFEYNRDLYKVSDNLEEIDFNSFHDADKVSWLNVYGISNPYPVEFICSKLGIHNLVLEDILDLKQRPKLQEFEKYLQFSMKSVIEENASGLTVQQISFIIGKNYLLSFQEKQNDYFSDIRLRIKEKKGIICERTVDYLLFLLIDALLENYFKSVDITEQKIEKLVQFDVSSELHPRVVFQIEKLKSDVLLLKKLVEPVRTEILNIQNDQDFIRQNHLKYFEELKDQCNQLLDEINSLNNRLESANNLFFSLQGYKMNQVMKTLTIIATIFIPLTFIVGVYGMNFKYMPELEMKYGYWGIWILMIIAIFMMISYFKKKKWF